MITIDAAHQGSHWRMRKDCLGLAVFPCVWLSLGLVNAGAGAGGGGEAVL